MDNFTEELVTEKLLPEILRDVGDLKKELHVILKK